jgi:hypothetical protein
MALWACSGGHASHNDEAMDGGEPCVEGEAGIEVRIDVPCCDFNEPQLTITYPTVGTMYYDVDASHLRPGEALVARVPYPQGAVPGPASAYFFTGGAGTHFYEGTAEFDAEPTLCTVVEIAAHETGPMDAGP